MVWWRDIITKLTDTFIKGIATPNVHDGKSVLFWHDLWEGRILAHRCPQLMSYAISMATVHSILVQGSSLQDFFHLPLSEEAF
jgi:hypothetical protein